MAINFSDTLAAITAELNQKHLAFGILLGAMLLLWFGWLFLGQLDITRQASGIIELEQSAIKVVSSVDGRVETVNVAIDEDVIQGSSLIILDAQDEKKQIKSLEKSLNEQLSVLAALQNTHTNEVEKLTLQRDALLDDEKTETDQLTVIQSQFTQQQETVNLLNTATAAVSKIELQREQLQLKQIQERLLSKQQTLAGVKSAYKQLVQEQEAAAARFAQSVAHQQALIAKLEAELSQQQQSVLHKSLVAPKDARVAEIMPLQPGQWITAGTHLATLLPKGNLRVVAQFKPVDAQGHLLVGQKAKVQVDSFPWLQYGALTAQVIQLSQAERDGSVRVMLDFIEQPHLALQHGMTAKIIVSVADASPWELLLQSLGRRQE